MRRFIGSQYLVFVSFSWLTATCLAVGVAGHVDDLLVSEKYTELRALHVADLDDPRKHDDALAALFNLAIESNSALAADEATRWTDELASARKARDGDRARSLAPLLTWNAEAAFRHQDLAAANRGMQQAQDLLTHGVGKVTSAEQAYVESFAAQLTGMQGHYDEALVHAQRALDIVNKPKSVLERQRLIRALYFRAMFQDRNGDYTAAIDSAQRGLRENAIAAGSARNGNRRRLIGMLAEILISRGDFAEVQRLMRPELDALRKQVSPSPRDMAYTLGHLAEAERHLGDRDAALVHAHESAEFAAKDPAIVASGSYAAILGNLGALAFEMGHYAEADDALARNLQLTEQQFGPTNARLVAPLISAGEVALERELLDIAEADFRRALAIVATELGPQHPEGTPALRGLGKILLRRGHADLAEPLLTGALAQRRASIGDSHPELLAWRCDLALAQAGNAHSDLAFQNALDVEQARTHLVATIAPALGESQALDFKHGLGHCADLMLALAARRNDPASSMAAWTEVAAARGLATRIGVARLSAARQSADPQRRARWDTWRQAAQAYARAFGEGVVATELTELRRAVDTSAQALGTESAAQKALDRPLSELLKARPVGSSLLAYVHYNSITDVSNDKKIDSKSAHLYAFLATDAAPIRLFDLGDGAAVDALSERWYGALLHPERSGDELREAGLALRARIFDPLGLIEKPGTLLVVPDAGLYRVNFAALPAGEGFLVEHGLRVHTFDTEHDLLRDASIEPAASMLLMGAPDGSGRGELAQLRGDCPALGQALAPLPGAKQEMEALAQLARTAGMSTVTALSGRSATMQALLRDSPQAEIIHFATHAIEFGGQCAPLLATVGRRGVGVRRDNIEVSDARVALSRQAALVLSADHQNNGLLFDADVATLALDQARWVVLSACDTGLGARLDDEGIFGLRRAFRLAGARTVVMSLWQVDDTATADWMDSLYKARLVQKRTTVDAVADASLAVLAARRATGKSTHPFYWAAFIASGDWR